MFARTANLAEFNPAHVVIWFLLAFQAGAINTGGLMAFHRFVSHMTGFASHFAAELAMGHTTAAVGMLSVPIFFLLGSVVSGLLIDRPLCLGRPPLVTWAAAIMTFLLFTAAFGGSAGWFGKFGAPEFASAELTLIALLAMTAGIQNAAISSASGAVVRTTHLTGITTDLGVGLVRSWSSAYNQQVQRRESLANQVRVGLILSFLLGSGVSAYLYLRVGYSGFWLPALCSVVFLLFCLYRGILRRADVMSLEEGKTRD